MSLRLGSLNLGVSGCNRPSGSVAVFAQPSGGATAERVCTPAGWRIRGFNLDERRFEEAAARLQAHMARVDGG